MQVRVVVVGAFPAADGALGVAGRLQREEVGCFSLRAIPQVLPTGGT